MLETFRELFEYSGWANTRILAALNSAPQDHSRARHLLAHLLVSEKIWLLRLRGDDTSAINKSPELSGAECETLSKSNQKACGDLLGSLTAAELTSLVTYKNFKSTEFRTSIRDILMHVALHETYHRGQIATAMRQEGGVPVDTDFISFVREKVAN